jgi:histidyl-tRNA synthetase
MEKPTLPKGTRDFGPAAMAKRQFIFNCVRTVFHKFGFLPLETPAMENLSTLMGKYGEEGDQLLFRILNSGDFLKDVGADLLAGRNSKQIAPDITEKGLRYDLTVPFARYVVMNRHEIALPFKRYQIQPVWRADRPQKGRYREFYQCDADVVGTNSLVCETEIILMIKEVFEKLNIQDYSIKINHRGVLAGIAEVLNVKGSETNLYTAIDKLDKIGERGVREELLSKGFEKSSLDDLFSLLKTSGDNQQKIEIIKKKFQNSEAGTKGTSDLQEILALLKCYQVDDNHVEVDVALARGLSYYTGTIFEVKINNVAIGSVSGGGRYDHLTQAFGAKEPLPGIGISFGVDRIYDAMEELNLFPKETQLSSRVLICHLDQACMTYGIKILAQLRASDIAAEIYPDLSKLKKQLDYANKKNIPFAIVIGSEEMTSGNLVIKNMETGEQRKLSLDQILQQLTIDQATG